MTPSSTRPPRAVLLRRRDGSYTIMATCPCLAVVLVHPLAPYGRCEACGGDVEADPGTVMALGRA